jgi:hypothetical protein
MQVGEPVMTNLQESEITFPVGGIFGVGRLATMLKALAESGRIGPWHIGHLDRLPAHAIRIQFDSRTDGEVAKDSIENWHSAHVPTGNGTSDAPEGKA